MTNPAVLFYTPSGDVPEARLVVRGDRREWISLVTFHTHYVWFTGGDLLVWTQTIAPALVALLLWPIVGWSMRDSFNPIFVRSANL